MYFEQIKFSPNSTYIYTSFKAAAFKRGGFKPSLHEESELTSASDTDTDTVLRKIRKTQQDEAVNKECRIPSFLPLRSHLLPNLLPSYLPNHLFNHCSNQSSMRLQTAVTVKSVKFLPLPTYLFPWTTTITFFST